MSFDTTELDSNTNDTIYKGVEVIKGMFGMAPATTLAGTTEFVWILMYTFVAAIVII